MARYIKKRKLIHLYLIQEDNQGEIKKYLDSQISEEKDCERWIYLLNKSFYEIDDDLKDMFFDIIKEYKEKKIIDEILIIEKPKYLNQKYIKELKQNGIRNIEIKAYSSNSYILSQIEEDSFKEVEKVVKRLKLRRMRTFIEMQIGLPESNELDEIQTAKSIVKLKPYLVKIRPTLVFKDTILEDKYNNIEYRPLKLDEAIELTKKLLIFFENKKIPEIQIGFDEYDQLNTNIVKEKQDSILKISQTPSFIDGPYDENFNFFVYSSMFYDKVLNIIKKYNMKVKKIQIEVHPNIAKFVTGIDNINLNNFRKNYDIDTIIKQSLKLPKQEIKVKILETYTDFIDD